MTDDLKTIETPSIDTLRERLMGMFGEQHTANGLAKALSPPSRKNGCGLVLMTELAIYDYCTGMPSMIGTILRMRQREIVKALTTDAEVLADATKMMDVVDKERAK